MYPDENTPTRLFNGTPFREVPICDIKASKNNTIISVSDAQGGSLIVSFIRILLRSFSITVLKLLINNPSHLEV